MPAISVTSRADQATSETELGHSPRKDPLKHLAKADVLVAGSLAIDLSCDFAPTEVNSTTPALHTSNRAIIGQSLGGVGHNVAIAAKYLDSSVLYCSVVGDDLSGQTALTSLRQEGLSTSGIKVLPASSGARTAQYVAVNDAKKDLVVAMADMGIMELPEQTLDFDGFWEPMMSRAQPQWAVVDANWNAEVLGKWVALAKKHGARVAFEPVSTAKSGRLFRSAIGPSDCVPNHSINLAAPNQLELAAMYMAAREGGLFDSEGWWHLIDAMRMPASGSRERLVAMTSAMLVNQGIPQQSIQLLPFIPCIVTKLGPQGVLLAQLLRPGDARLTSPESAPYILSRASTAEGGVGGVYLRLFPPAAVLEEAEIVSVNGAGDTLLGAVVTGLARGRAVEEVIPGAQKASLLTLQQAGGVSEAISQVVFD